MCVFAGGWSGQQEEPRLICAYLDYTGSSCLRIQHLRPESMGSIYDHVLLDLLEGGCNDTLLALLCHFLLLKGRGREQQGRGYVDANNEHASQRRTCRQVKDWYHGRLHFLDLAP